jgi:reductive dehalogenase
MTDEQKIEQPKAEQPLSERLRTASSNLSRRDFLKIVGVAGIAAQAGGLVAAGIETGEDSETYTGWESFNPGTQTFNRKPYEIEGRAHKPVSEVRRPSHTTDYVFGRVRAFEVAYNEKPDWTLDDPLEDLNLSPVLIDFYKEFPERLEWDFKTFSETIPTWREDAQKYGNYYLLADAYSNGFSYHGGGLPHAESPPEESDFQMNGQPIRDPAVPFKSPALASEYIKEIAHRFGATLVGITRAYEDFFYSEGWAGCPEDYDFSKLPEHWKYAIVIGVPMEWDVVLGSPNISTSFDAYDRVSTAAVRLEGALKFLGYAARTNAPMTYYDLIVPPFAVEAGLGEVSRPGFCVTPEVGSNLRTAVIITNLELEIDKPIDFGVAEFCNKCKICAEQCPSGAISMADSPDGLVIRGYEHWYINNGACYNFWRESMGPIGCRLCVAVCPYSRKDNWIHDLARAVDPRDPTGIVSSSLLWMQKNFFDYPEAEDYHRPPTGHFVSFRTEPEFLQAKRYLDLDIVSPHDDD